jgi:hypothetical protein
MPTKVQQFTEWAETQGAEVEVTQEDDGSGYTCMKVNLPYLWNGITFDITVNEDKDPPGHGYHDAGDYPV